ncbi:MAG: PEP-CTERM sorting domain-containing protein [Tepidisphaeraceae bacterium]
MTARRIAFGCFATLLVAPCARATVVFSEDMGVPSSTSIASNVFQNSGRLSYSGTGAMSSASPSTGAYTGASGNGNVLLNATLGLNFQIASIDTTGYAPGSLDLSFGAYKSGTTSDMTDLLVSYSTDGQSYTTIPAPAQPTGTGTAIWRLISLNDTAIPVASTVRLRWTRISSTTTYRVDDVTLSGDKLPVFLSAIGSTTAAPNYTFTVDFGRNQGTRAFSQTIQATDADAADIVSLSAGSIATNNGQGSSVSITSTPTTGAGAASLALAGTLGFSGTPYTVSIPLTLSDGVTNGTVSGSVTISVIPEPASLLGLSVLGIALKRRRK